jgi:hypothetical protein
MALVHRRDVFMGTPQDEILNFVPKSLEKTIDKAPYKQVLNDTLIIRWGDLLLIQKKLDGVISYIALNHVFGKNHIGRVGNNLWLTSFVTRPSFFEVKI